MKRGQRKRMFAMHAQRVADHMAAQHGIEKTPDEWEVIFVELLADYRKRYPTRTQGRSNVQVWNMIYKELVTDQSA